MCGLWTWSHDGQPTGWTSSTGALVAELRRQRILDRDPGTFTATHDPKSDALWL